MYVCCCNAVTDREVADSIEAGARTRADVTRACGAGGDCGACHGMIDEMLEANEARRSAATKGEHSVSLLPAAALVRERAA